MSSNPLVANTVGKEDTDRDIYLNIMTCNRAQYEMVKSIAGDKHNVEFMFNNEKASIDFRYTDETISNISNMDLFFYSGNSMEPWSNDLIGKLKKGNVGIINTSRGIRTINLSSENGGKDNPYYLAGFEEYKIALYNIKSAIQDRDPKNRELYEENYNKAVKAIEEGLKVFDKKSKALKDYQFVALDDNMDYFYRELGISPIKAKNNSILRVIRENRLDPNKVIVLRDKDVPFGETSFRVIELQRYCGVIPPAELLLNNHKVFYDAIPEPKNGDIE